MRTYGGVGIAYYLLNPVLGAVGFSVLSSLAMGLCNAVNANGRIRP